ncbi:MAG: hypothetical protein HYZ22_11890 [Chloroflexi bacterium]|nr:hypothetical protein [Chloroflexota bacterium]
MTLPPSDGKLFFELMWKLQYYANQKRGFHKNIRSMEEYASLDSKKKLNARNELWKDPDLISAYVRENPDKLPAEELQIVEKWTRFIQGSFFLFRHLKKGSVFIKDDLVYSVHGIQDPLEEVIPTYALPQMVEAVLLPFKGQIVYDGLLMGYRVHFGGGIRSDLNDAYNAAKQKIESLPRLNLNSLPRPSSNQGKTLRQNSGKYPIFWRNLKGITRFKTPRLTLPGSVLKRHS